MNNNVKDNLGKKESKIMFFSLLGVLTLITAIAGATYAYFSATATNNNVIKGESAYDADALSLEVNQVSAGEGKLVPQLNSAIQKAVEGASGKGSCIDANGNTICKVYSIKITNNSNVALNVSGTLTLTATNMTNLRLTKVTGATTGFPTPTGTYNTVSTTALADTSLSSMADTANNNKTFYVVIWISETNTAQEDKHAFSVVVTFNGYIQGDDSQVVNGITSTIRG